MNRYRINFTNNFCSMMLLEIDGKQYSIKGDETQEILIYEDSCKVKISGLLITDEFNINAIENPNIKDKISMKLINKIADKTFELALQVNCTYKLSNLGPNTDVDVELDCFSLGDKALTYQNFIIIYPKVISSSNVELTYAVGNNANKFIKKLKHLGLGADLGMGFFTMILSYPLRGAYFKHLCKPKILLENIKNADKHKEKENKSKKKKGIGCLIPIIVIAVIICCQVFISPVLFVKSDKPALVSKDYSTITYEDNTYKRIDDLPNSAKPQTALGSEIWVDSRTDGLSRLEQASQDDKVMLYSDDNYAYLWLVQDYVDTIYTENGDEKEYKDFKNHYVYVCENK